MFIFLDKKNTNMFDKYHSVMVDHYIICLVQLLC